MKIPGAIWREWFRIHDEFRDVIDRHLRRICCARTEDAGGYRHWRCGRRRGHSGPHRFNNYIWPDADGRTAHDPIDAKHMMSVDWQRPPKRHGSPSRREVRAAREAKR